MSDPVNEAILQLGDIPNKKKQNKKTKPKPCTLRGLQKRPLLPENKLDGQQQTYISCAASHKTRDVSSFTIQALGINSGGQASWLHLNHPFSPVL